MAIPNLKQHWNTVKIQSYFTKNTLNVTFFKFPRPFIPQQIPNLDSKLKLRQNTVCSVTNFTQCLQISHHPGWCGWWHFPSLSMEALRSSPLLSRTCHCLPDWGGMKTAEQRTGLSEQMPTLKVYRYDWMLPWLFERIFFLFFFSFL